MSRDSLEFGSGHFVGALNDPAFHELPIRDQARLAGWVNGCPVVEKLTDPANAELGRGPEAMLNRYGEINQWFTFIERAVSEVNPTLGYQFGGKAIRKVWEPVGQYEPESVPEDEYKFVMAPMNTAWGYAMPRLMSKQVGKATLEENQARQLRGMEALDVAAQTASTPAELLAIFAEELAGKGDVNPHDILSTALSKGWFDEHNARTMRDEVKAALEAKAFRLWGLYSKLPAVDKAKLA